MAAVEYDLVRTASQNSTLSNPRHRSIQRVRPSKRASNASLSRSRSRQPSPPEDTKSLTSFPSLSPSPEASPVQSRINGWFRATSGVVDEIVRHGDIHTVASPDTVIAVTPPDTVKNTLPAAAVKKVTRSTQQMVGSLMGAPSARDRSALFDDAPTELSKVPGNLHFSTDENIKDAIEQAGAVTLVRQLAGDLAQREAHPVLVLSD